MEKEKNLLTFILFTDDQSVCQWARIIHNQIQIWGENKVNPLCDPATICALVIGLFCRLHHELIQPEVLMIHINTEFQTKPVEAVLQSVKLDSKRLHTNLYENVFWQFCEGLLQLVKHCSALMTLGIMPGLQRFYMETWKLDIKNEYTEIKK